MSVFPTENQVLSNRPVALDEGKNETAPQNTVSRSTFDNQNDTNTEQTPASPPQKTMTQPQPVQATTAPKPEPEISARMEERKTEPVLQDIEEDENNIAHKIHPQPETAQMPQQEEPEAHISAFKQNYGDIDHATNDLLLPKKNVQAAQDRFISELEKDTSRVGIRLVKQEPFFSSPLDNSAEASILLLFRDIPLIKIHFKTKGKDLQDIHAKRTGSYTSASYPVETVFTPRLAKELAYDLDLDPERDERGIKALVRPFKHIAEAQPYRYVFDEEGHLNTEESQEERLKHHFVMMASQLVFAASQLGIKKREPTFVDPNENSDYFE